MSKKLISAICSCTILVCAGVCAIGYIIGNSNFPWWLLIVTGGVACAIISMIGEITREQDKEKKKDKLIGCISASISMISVLVFLALMMLTKIQHSWIIVVIGGIASSVIHLLYNATKTKN